MLLEGGVAINDEKFDCAKVCGVEIGDDRIGGTAGLASSPTMLAMAGKSVGLSMGKSVEARGSGPCCDKRLFARLPSTDPKASGNDARLAGEGTGEGPPNGDTC